MKLTWEERGMGARAVDETGRIVGEVEYTHGGGFRATCGGQVGTWMGRYNTAENAKKAVERAALGEKQ